jgi:NADP-dependent 3-hydroxy acid dehydrogenase YdfG
VGKTIAVVGVGPGVGLAVAERFGREGFRVALLSRQAAALDGYAKVLKARGIDAAAFPADVLDRPGLAKALEAAARHFGTIDVLEYGVTPTADTLRTPRAITVENEKFHLDMAVLGAVAAVEAVLPGMLQRKDGGLLFTTAASAQHPVAFSASFGVAAGAALNYARVLFRDLAADGIYAGIVAIAGLVTPFGRDPAAQSSGSGLSVVTAEAVAQRHWDLYTKRDTAEAVVGDVERVKRMAAGAAVG